MTRLIAFCRGCGTSLSAQEGPLHTETVQQLIYEYRQQITQHPDDDSARYALGLAYLYHSQFALSRTGQFKQAQQAIDQAVCLQPDRAEFRRIAQQIEGLT